MILEQLDTLHFQVGGRLRPIFAAYLAILSGDLEWFAESLRIIFRMGN